MSGIRVVTSFDDLDSCIVLNFLDPTDIFGDKYPLLHTPKVIEWNKKKESKGEYFLRIEYLNQNPEKKDKLIADDIARREKHVEDKPFGYWDNIFTNNGIYYKVQTYDLLQKISSLPFNENLISKMSYDGVVKSDPKYIYKIILIIRYPHNKKEREFLEKTISLCKWLLLNPEVDTHIIDYDNLSLDATKLRINTVLGKEHIKDIEGVIPKYPAEPENTIRKICDLMLVKDIESARDLALKELSERNRGSRTWKCLRTGKNTNEEQCKTCMGSKEFREALKKRAINKQVDWMHQPCLFECGKSLDLEPITFETSIKNNFWV